MDLVTDTQATLRIAVGVLQISLETMLYRPARFWHDPPKTFQPSVRIRQTQDFCTLQDFNRMPHYERLPASGFDPTANFTAHLDQLGGLNPPSSAARLTGSPDNDSGSWQHDVPGRRPHLRRSDLSTQPIRFDHGLNLTSLSNLLCVGLNRKDLREALLTREDQISRSIIQCITVEMEDLKALGDTANMLFPPKSGKRSPAITVGSVVADFNEPLLPYLLPHRAVLNMNRADRLSFH
jgi:hypothetical protein